MQGYRLPHFYTRFVILPKNITPASTRKTKSAKKVSRQHNTSFPWGTLILYALGGFFFITKMYFLSTLFLMYASMGTVDFIDSMFDKQLSNIPKRHIYRSMAYIFLLIGIASGGIYFIYIVSNEGLAPDVITDIRIPRNFNAVAGDSVHSFVVDLNKEDSPVYILVRPLSDSKINFSIYNPHGRQIAYIPDFHLMNFGSVRTGKYYSTLVFELCYLESGKYRVDIQLLRPDSDSITAKIFRTNTSQFLNIDYSTCP